MNPTARRLLVVPLAVTGLLVVLLLAFALPAVNTGAHGVPVGFVGPEPVAAALAERADGVEVTSYADREAASAAILDREVYGAVVVSPEGGVEVLTAGAASTAAAGLVEQAGRALAAGVGGEVVVTDLRPLPDDDPRGAGLAAGALPLALGGWIGAMVVMLTFPGTRQRLIGATVFAVLGGLSLTAVLQYVLGTLDGSFWLTALGACFGLAATAAAVLGLRTAFGNAGLGVAAVLLILLGNPLSGLTSAPEMLPSPWGAIGQLLPPGATGSLLRGLAYFDGAGTLGAWLVLGCWLVGGLAFVGYAARRTPTPTPMPESALA